MQTKAVTSINSLNNLLMIVVILILQAVSRESSNDVISSVSIKQEPEEDSQPQLYIVPGNPIQVIDRHHILTGNPETPHPKS